MTRTLFGTRRQLRLEITDPSQVGECRRTAQRMAEAHEFDATAVGRVGIVATELATNVLRHGRGGELLLQPLEDPSSTEIEMLALDRGPGMVDVERCLQDGYSTGGTAGTGLGAISRLSSVFDLYSRPGRGTIVLARAAGTAASAVSGRERTPSRTQVGAVSIPKAGETECGDSWRAASDGDRFAVLVADGLGHGPLAAVPAEAAAAAFSDQPFDEPTNTLQRAHRRLSGTRGAAAACARLDGSSRRVSFAGVGNIAGVVSSGATQKGLVSHNGTLGVTLRHSAQFDYDWDSRSVLIMHSDGITSRWSLSANEGLAQCHPAVIAGLLYRDHSRGTDDCTIVVALHRP